MKRRYLAISKHITLDGKILDNSFQIEDVNSISNCGGIAENYVISNRLRYLGLLTHIIPKNILSSCITKLSVKQCCDKTIENGENIPLDIKELDIDAFIDINIIRNLKYLT